ncbi:hypothetical protein C8R42DRAFT_718931 [Lentinula raphanica]|nr:hypothetical protein C8R42DRAFT_718931 [Lentinula raphanica]
MYGNLAFNDLKMRFMELSAEHRAVKHINSTYESLINNRNAFPAASVPSSSVPAASTPYVGPESSSMKPSARLPKIECTYDLLAQDECPNICFFFEKDWNEYREMKKNTSNKPPTALGCLQADDGSFTSDDPHRLSLFYQHAKSIFNYFYTVYLDAESWGKISSEVAIYFYRAMAAEFPEFRYCNDGKWKARVYAVGKYPDWKRDYRDKGKLLRDPAIEALRVDTESKKSRLLLSSPPDTITGPSIDISEDQESLLSRNLVDKPQTTPIDVPPTVENTAVAPRSSMPDEPDLILSSSSPTANASSPFPQSPVLGPAPQTNSSSSTLPAMPNANLPSASSNSSTLSSSTGDTMLLTPDLSSSSNVPVRFAKCNPLSGFRVTSILAPPTEPSSPMITKPKGLKPKKMDEAMVADPASITARNLFAIDYLKNNTCTKSEFKDAWNALGSSGQKHWNSLSKELKKGKKNNGNNKND